MPKEYPIIDVIRTSSSRPNQLKLTSPHLFKHFKYDGELRYHLIESVLNQKLSDECIEYAYDIGYKIHVINPSKGSGYPMYYALNTIAQSDYIFRCEDDFMPEMDIPITDCIKVMEKYRHVNQICFNKRRTLDGKWVEEWREDEQKCVRFKFIKEQRYFKVGKNNYPMVVKDRWWFGAGIWRVSFIKRLFKFWDHNTHSRLNDEILMPLAGFVYGDEHHGWKGRKQPTPEQVEKNVGCYVWGKTGDPRMFFHSGLGDSIFLGETQKRWREEGRKVLG